MESLVSERNKTPLTRIFNNSIARILDFLILNQKFDYSESDISRLTSVPRRTFERILPILLQENIIERTRKSGKAYMYKLNLESERALALQEYVRASLKENLDSPNLSLNNQKQLQTDNDELIKQPM